ncbi:MAG TPA: DUF5686 and carboxypeptidase regulatory-like domain-containing protein [Bacteroidia bacterium]|nr:DUF5686 and carboxypeptidase regulatory-like domain-containing protein [Bacteroidia bacterium]
MSCITNAQAFLLSGKITGNREALPFATVYVKGSSTGSSSNQEGKYELKLEKGHYTVVFQYLGYNKKEVDIDLKANKKLDVDLNLDGISLGEVTVLAGKDPAYPIIRKSIQKRNYYLEQVKTYSCQVYVKGLQKLKDIPENLKKLIKMTSGEKIDSSKLGIVYLSESESEYYYTFPDKQKEVLYSSKVSGESSGFSFNQFNQIRFEFNENLVKIPGLSERPLVSPLHHNALWYYRYTLLGSFEEDGRLVHKIRVKPRQANNPCFTGMVYIQDSTWRLCGVDLELTKAQKIKFVDTLHIRQTFAPVSGDSVWMPVNHHLSFNFRFMGIIGDGYGNAHAKNFNLRPDIPPGFFDNELLLVKDDANKKDSLYWLQNRPVPLTEEEKQDYHKKDSAEIVESSDHFKDSVDHIHNTFRPASLFFGYNYSSTRKQINFNSPGILSSGIQYNTVEGLNLIYNFTLHKTYEDQRAKRLNGKIRYGFSNALWGGELGYNTFFEPKKFSRLGFKVKSIVEQFNPAEPITPLINTFYTLLANENYLKLYKETAVESSYFTEIRNGVFFNTVVKYAQRDPLKNSADYLWIDDKQKLFTSNDPQHISTDDSAFTSNRALTAEFSFSFRFRQKYFSRPNQKVIIGSKFPRLNITYRKAIPTLNCVTNYDLLSAMIYDDVQLGLFGTLGYRLRAGGFLNTNTMYFMDYKHFLGNQTIFNTSDYLNSYRLLPYYEYSSDRWYAEIHAEHHFNGFLFNAIPLVKKLKAQEVVGGHFLFNNKIKQYYEINFAIENIFGFLRVDYVLAYGLNKNLNSGFIIGINSRL